MGPLESGRLATRNFQKTGEWIDRVVLAIRFLPSVVGIAFYPSILATALVSSLLLQMFSWGQTTPRPQMTFDLMQNSTAISPMIRVRMTPPSNHPTAIMVPPEQTEIQHDFEVRRNPVALGSTDVLELSRDCLTSFFPALPLMWPQPSSWVAWFSLLLSWGVFGYTGVLIARSTSRKLALRDVGLYQLIREAGSGWWTLSAAMGLLLLSYCGCQLALAGLASLSRIPVAGSTISILESPLTITISILAGGVLLLVSYAWPILATCWATDDCDGFGTISRTVSYLTTGFFPALLLGLLATVIAWLLLIFVKLLLVNAVSASTPWIFPPSSGLTAWEKTSSTGFVIVDRAVLIALFWTILTGWTLAVREFVDAMPTDSPEVFDRGLKPREPYPVVGLAAVAPQLASGDLPVEQRPSP